MLFSRLLKRCFLLSWLPLLRKERKRAGSERCGTFQCGRNISGGSYQEEASLSISQQAKICRTSLKVTSALKALKLQRANCNPFAVNTDGLHDSTLTTMSSLTQIQRPGGQDGTGILTHLDKSSPQLTKSAMGVSLSLCLRVPL